VQKSAVQFCEFRTAKAVSTFCLTLFCCRFTSNRGSVMGSTRRHANVLCACAIVTAIPYTSPSLQWFSDLLFQLCHLSDEGGQVGVSVCRAVFLTTSHSLIVVAISQVRSTISQFRKVHNDTWQDLRLLFKEDVWESINSSTTSHSYFA
jgi:hypothetical protein